MSAIIYGIAPNQVIAQPDFRATRDADGKWSGSRSYTIRKEDKHSQIVLRRFERGEKITALSTDLDTYWDFLQCESFDIEDQPGGIAKVFVTFAGYGGGLSDTDREKVYSLRGVLGERPIYLHPKFIEAFASYARGKEALTKFVDGKADARGTEAANWRVFSIADQEDIVGTGGWVSTGTGATSTDEWFKIIVEDGWRSYDAPQYEWTVSESNSGGLSASQIASFGKKDTPDGNPPEPSGVTGWWQFVDLGDERSSNGSSNNRTWRFREGSIASGTANKIIYDY